MIELPDVQFLHRLADAADNETLPRFRQPLPVHNKAKPDRDFDPVTDADRRAELVLRELITREYPEHAILGEEFGATGGAALQWVLDPIDGTKPFICGIPVWGTLIGLTVEGRAKLGMMSQPFTGERFWADAHGAWQRGLRGTARLSVSQVTNLSEAILHTTSLEFYRGELRGVFDTLRGKVRMTRYGGECYAFAMLAAGLIDLCLEPSLQPYDIIPIIPIVERAGGRVTCLDGSRAEKGGAVLLSATAELHERALEILNTGGQVVGFDTSPKIGQREKMEEVVSSIAQHVARLDGLVAFAVGGSSVRQVAGVDEASDIDLYAFVQEPLTADARETLINALGVTNRDNLAVDYWGASDQWVDPGSGRHIDLMYFEAPWMRQEIEAVLDHHRARLGYTTCFCYTIAHATVLLDPHGWLAEMQHKCRQPYPEPLRESIVTANHRAMRGILSSYEAQIRKAAARGDLVSVNHRIAALLASYFDLLFAANRQLHPGEKRLISLAQELCPARPATMESDLAAVLAHSGSPAELVQLVAQLLDQLDAFIADGSARGDG